MRWTERILESERDEEALAVVREYLATWTAEQIAEIPEGTWPRELANHDDVKTAAANVKIAELSQPREAQARTTLRELGGALSAASLRLAQLARITRGPRAQ
jgi:hypothetical protein